ncbi:MAG: excalibur calcium-binding domain-containing protein [Sphingomonas bacterium]|nr:excalibur calcium-binding domain-containing protein [Sphingomonas bacterium]
MSAKETLITVVLIGAAAVVAWQSTTPATLMSAADAERIETSVYYAGCNQVRDLGKAPLYAGQPGYRESMDGDHDGIACEPIR